MIHARTAQLDALMRKHKLTAKQVGTMLDRKAHTVRCWRCDARIIPAHSLELLRVKLSKAKAGKA